MGLFLHQHNQRHGFVPCYFSDQPLLHLACEETLLRKTVHQMELLPVLPLLLALLWLLVDACHYCGGVQNESTMGTQDGIGMKQPESFLKELDHFFKKAGQATYAGGGIEVKPWRTGFRELEYKKGPFYYRDSYAGFFTSAGQEVIYFDDKPVWTSSYGGGMKPNYHQDEAFTHQTFTFLKKALSKKESSFQPRGPKRFQQGDWQYHCTFKGNIKKFKGSEKVLYKNKTVFTHDFFGGLIVSKS